MPLKIAGLQMNDPWAFEKEAAKRGFVHVAGIDEAGRGPLAGPVVSAAVILPENFVLGGVRDSKKLTPKKRDSLYEAIYEKAISIGIGIVDALEIDRINILQAALLSMRISTDNLSPTPDFLLVDGPYPIPSPLPQNPVKKGDSLSISIACASIIAKVTRDRLMMRYDVEYPMFGFAKHKGYPTAAHKDAISRFGASPIHRYSFRGVKGTDGVDEIQ